MGQPVLEVPVQVNGVPESLLDYAHQQGVLIRDVAGREYGQR